MSQRDPLLQKYDETLPGRFRVVRRIEVQQEIEGKVSPNVRVIISLQSAKDNRLLTLGFEGVQNLRLVQPEWTLFEMPVLEIQSIRERQMEDLNYEVRETDNDTVAFSCRTFSILVEG